VATVVKVTKHCSKLKIGEKMREKLKIKIGELVDAIEKREIGIPTLSQIQLFSVFYIDQLYLPVIRVIESNYEI
jgi:positive regulator of sigma E activity